MAEDICNKDEGEQVLDHWGVDDVHTSRPAIIFHSFKLNTYPLNNCCHFSESFTGSWVASVFVWMESETESVNELVKLGIL